MRPRNKAELLSAGANNFEKIELLLDQMDPAVQNAEFTFEGRDRNVRDVLWHLHSWHKLFFTWYQVGMAGGKPEMPAPGYTWKTNPDLNQKLWEEGAKFSLAEVLEKLTQSQIQLQQLIGTHSDEELFVKRYYPWTGTTSLGSYLVSATSSHYEWALKILRKHLKSVK